MTTSQIGKSSLNGNSKNILNYAVTRHATMTPIMMPSTPAATMTRNASYMKIRLPYSMVIPIDLKTPYSQILSLMLLVVATSSKKNVRISEMTPIIPTIKVNTMLMVFNDSIKAKTSTIIG